MFLHLLPDNPVGNRSLGLVANQLHTVVQQVDPCTLVPCHDTTLVESEGFKKSLPINRTANCWHPHRQTEVPNSQGSAAMYPHCTTKWPALGHHNNEKSNENLPTSNL